MTQNDTFKIGDTVTVTDRAWSRILNSYSKNRVARWDRYGRVRQFKILAIDCKIPIYDDGSNRTTNTLMLADDNQEIITVNDCNLRGNVTHIGIQYIAAGKNVTMKLSEQSKQAVLKAHLDVGV